MTIVAITALLITLVLIATAVIAVRSTKGSSGPTFALFCTAACLAVVMLGVTIWAGYLVAMPEYRYHRATVEKRILVEQAKAEADAAVEEARAEVERAKGTSAANKIVADSITEPYLRYLYINGLKNTKNQVIYLPTEAGLPILEADRLAQK